MSKRKVLILFIFIVFCNKITAQDTLHLCVGTIDNNFSVPYTIGSTYQWQIHGDPSIAIITSGNGTEHIKIDLNNTGVFKLVLHEDDINSCEGSDSIFIEVHPLPSPSIFALGPISFCEGDSVQLQVDSSYHFMLWNHGPQGVSTYIDSSGDYFVNVTDDYGCSNISSSLTVDVHPNPFVDFLIYGVCNEHPTIFTDISTIPSDNIIQREWNLGDGTLRTGTSITHTYNIIGNYITSLIITSDFGCIDSLTKSIVIYPNPMADFTFYPNKISTLDPTMFFTNTSVGNGSYLWDFGDSNFDIIEHPSHTFDNPGPYDVMLTVVDNNNCIDSITYTIMMYYDFVLYIPNSFTPNDDNNNDVFKPEGLRMDKYRFYSFKIFNRWGDNIFSTNDFSQGWDGSSSISGSYSWSVVIEDELGSTHRKTGVLQLIK